ncbi:MAG TPA: FAD/NAD(P)-binding oxidoreductase, partial [Acidimicrobiales bacterium]|nr:FAD/NAD(P)-binding oxidoreductase [Acidimicrobiales bacterium]
MHEERCDLAVVGAGPAGMSAAVTAAEAGARVCVLDLGVRPGGQYWRWGPRTDDGRFHHGWRRFVALRGRYGAAERAGRIAHRGLHGVYALEPGPPWLVHAVEEPTRSPATVAAAAVLVATGAYDLQLPIPGWTLPGVMAAGGAQALLKGSGVAAGRRVVVAGTGPLLLPVAASLLAAGARVRAVVETAGAGGYLRRPAALGTVARRLPEAAGYALALARHRVPVLTGHAAVAAHGTAGLTHVTVAGVDRSGRPRPGSERTLAADVLATSYGFVPQ